MAGMTRAGRTLNVILAQKHLDHSMLGLLLRVLTSRKKYVKRLFLHAFSPLSLPMGQRGLNAYEG